MSLSSAQIDQLMAQARSSRDQSVVQLANLLRESIDRNKYAQSLSAEHLEITHSLKIAAHRLIACQIKYAERNKLNPGSEKDELIRAIGGRDELYREWYATQARLVGMQELDLVHVQSWAGRIMADLESHYAVRAVAVHDGVLDIYLRTIYICGPLGTRYEIGDFGLRWNVQAPTLFRVFCLRHTNTTSTEDRPHPFSNGGPERVCFGTALTPMRQFLALYLLYPFIDLAWIILTQSHSTAVLNRWRSV